MWWCERLRIIDIDPLIEFVAKSRQLTFDESVGPEQSLLRKSLPAIRFRHWADIEVAKLRWMRITCPTLRLEVDEILTALSSTLFKAVSHERNHFSLPSSVAKRQSCQLSMANERFVCAKVAGATQCMSLVLIFSFDKCVRKCFVLAYRLSVSNCKISSENPTTANVFHL